MDAGVLQFKIKRSNRSVGSVNISYLAGNQLSGEEECRCSVGLTVDTDTGVCQHKMVSDFGRGSFVDDTGMAVLVRIR